MILLLLIILVLILSILLAPIIFQLGQLITGLMVGYSFKSMTIAGLIITREDGRFRLSRAPPSHLPRCFAQFIMPAGKQGPTRRAIMILGGLVAHLLPAAAALLVAVRHFSDYSPGVVTPTSPVGHWPIHDWGDRAVILFCVFGAVNLLFFALALIPSQSPAGQFLRDWLQGKPVSAIDMQATTELYRQRAMAPRSPAPGESAQQPKSEFVQSGPSRIVSDAPLGTAWDESARAAIERSQVEATAAKNDYVGTKHLLLALVTAGSQKLWIEGLDPIWVRAAVHAPSDLNPRQPVSTALQPWTPRLKASLKRAVDRANKATRSVNVQDLWWGLLTDADSDCVALLESLGFRAATLLGMIENENRLPDFSGIQLPPGIRQG